MSKKIEDEIRLCVYEDYENGMTYAQLSEKYGIGKSTVGFIIKEFGAEKNKKHEGKTCPRCRKKVDLKGAKYCPWCGNDIRREGEILADKLEKILEYYNSFPVTAEDEIQRTIIEAANKLREA